MDRRTYFAVRGVLRLPQAGQSIRARPFLRALHTSTPRQNAAPPLTLQQLRAQKATAAIPLRSPWPWHTVSSTPEQIVVERTIYARPSDLPPTLLLFAAGVWGLFVFTYFALPDPRKREPTAEEIAEIELLESKAREAGFLARLGNRLAGSIFISAQPLLMGGVSVVLAAFVLGASRIVTRLTMVQVRSAAQGARGSLAGTSAADGQGRTFLRLTTVGHEMWRGMFGPRELEISQCRAYLMDANRATTMRLRVVDGQGQRKQYSFDRFPYSLDFREFQPAKDSAQDVVLSQNRLEHVFGPLKRGFSS